MTLNTQCFSTEITVLMCTSPIPSHPSTEKIEEVIGKIRAYPELARARILILVDGVCERNLDLASAYEEYRGALANLCNGDPKFQGCTTLFFREHTHQANMTRAALKVVQTPYIFFCGHDMFPHGDIPWPGFLRALKEDDVNLIRLLSSEGIHPEWAHFYGPTLYRGGVPLAPTIQWSQRPHIACTNWYLRTIERNFRPDARTFIEPVMVTPVVERDWGQHCLWVYTPPGSRVGCNMSRCYTNDGREGHPSCESFFGNEPYVDLDPGFPAQ